MILRVFSNSKFTMTSWQAVKYEQSIDNLCNMPIVFVNYVGKVKTRDDSVKKSLLVSRLLYIVIT